MVERRGSHDRRAPVAVDTREGVDLWHCHACHEGGTVLDAVARREWGSDPRTVWADLGRWFAGRWALGGAP